jgi:isoleucyl-tRNA synthetase
MSEPFRPQRLEEGVLKFWAEKGIYRKVKKASAGRKPFFFADGPPYATGNIHMGTGWNKTIKDAYVRFWRMQGFDVWDQPGYDSHGTPIEYQVEKRLGFSNKKDIEAYGAARFIRQCRAFATKYIDVMSREFANIGVWLDWGNPYITLKNSYIEGAWFTFKRAHEKGLLYKGTYPVHVCPRCETGVSYNEIEYQTVSDDSIYVKFPIAGREREYFLIWTTTPWTIPSNTGIMVHPTSSYSMIEVESGEKYVLATELVETVMEKLGMESYTAVQTFSGDDLSGMLYEHPLKDLVPAIRNLKGAHRVVTSARYVTLDTGTGLVHTAPGFGAEDYHVGLQEGLPRITPVKIDGTFTGDAGKWLEGRFVKDADPLIVQKLSERNALLKKEPVSHEYPMCWRCGSALLQMSVPQWFFKITEIRNRLLEENRKVRWVPEWAGSRFRDWLQNLGDWPVSRQRYWGIPLPIWECPCGEIEVIGSFSELKRKSGLRKEIDFHRPEIDRVRIPCPKCGKPMRRTPDVLDVWFDSGVSTWAALEYPRKKALFERLWPSNFQVEGPDQFRGWWNSQMITSVLTFDRSPFGTIMLHGFILDSKGAKMSKSKGNVVTPEQVVGRYGRDAFRFYLMSSAPWDDFYFNWEGARETSKMFNVLWNIYQFVKTYAPKSPARRPRLRPEDRWIISRVNSLLGLSEQARQYMMHRLVSETADFILNDLSRWYIKLVRDRLSPWYAGRDRAAARYALHYVMERLVKILAPVSPFMSEHIYQEMFRKKPSVHAERWPGEEPRLVDRKLEKSMAAVKGLIESMNAAREERGFKLKWPLDAAYVYADKDAAGAVKSLRDVICFMGNVREVRLLEKASRGMKAFPGGRLGLGDVLKDEALVRELVRGIQVLRKREGLRVTESIVLSLKSDGETQTLLRKHERDILRGVSASRVLYGEPRPERGSCRFDGKTVHIGFRRAAAPSSAS